MPQDFTDAPLSNFTDAPMAAPEKPSQIETAIADYQRVHKTNDPNASLQWFADKASKLPPSMREPVATLLTALTDPSVIAAVGGAADLPNLARTGGAPHTTGSR